MQTKLKTLEEHNAQQRRAYDAIRKNGIACPECGEEMVDTLPGVETMSLPPKKSISCLKCGWHGMCHA